MHSGVPTFVYWLCAFLVDAIIALLIIVLMVAALYYGNVTLLTNDDGYKYTMYSLLAYAHAILPIIYIVSLNGRSPVAVLMAVTLVHLVAG
jgi:hypothetical protein